MCAPPIPAAARHPLPAIPDAKTAAMTSLPLRLSGFLAFALPCLLAIMLLAAMTLDAAAQQETPGPANRLFVQAMQIMQEADATLDPAREAQLLREADKLLRDIITRYPDSSLAVQLLTNQSVGDFDYYEFRGRVEALVCESPLTSLCFLYRISELLPPAETPVATARWDWLSLAVAYHHLGQTERAREIIAPFLAAVRRGVAVDTSGQDLFVARALSLMGETAAALDITRAIADCSTRLYNLSDIGKAAKWRGDDALAKTLAEETRSFAESRQCVWEYGLVVQALHRVGQDDAARALLDRTVTQQIANFRSRKEDCCPPELAVAAAEIGDPNLALNLLRAVQDENPWTIPAVLGRLALRGEISLTTAYAEQVPDIDLRGESFAELVDAAMQRNDRATADAVFTRLARLTGDAGTRRPALMAQRAKAERALYRDEGWRSAFQAALNAAERASNFIRRDIGAPLLAVLMRIETGHPMLD